MVGESLGNIWNVERVESHFSFVNLWLVSLQFKRVCNVQLISMKVTTYNLYCEGNYYYY